MALVELLLSPLPAHVRTARLVVVAAARRAGLDDEHVDELRLALGEACSRAVALHARHAPDTPVTVTVTDNPGGLTVTVADAGPAAGPVPDDLAGGLFDGPDDDDGDDRATPTSRWPSSPGWSTRSRSPAARPAPSSPCAGRSRPVRSARPARRRRAAAAGLTAPLRTAPTRRAAV